MPGASAFGATTGLVALVQRQTTSGAPHRLPHPDRDRAVLRGERGRAGRVARRDAQLGAGQHGGQHAQVGGGHRAGPDHRDDVGVRPRREADRERGGAGRPRRGQLRRVEHGEQRAGRGVERADRRGVVREPARRVGVVEADVLDDHRPARAVPGHDEQPALGVELQRAAPRRQHLPARGGGEGVGERVEQRGGVEQPRDVLRPEEERRHGRRSSWPA